MNISNSSSSTHDIRYSTFVLFDNNDNRIIISSSSWVYSHKNIYLDNDQGITNFIWLVHSWLELKYLQHEKYQMMNPEQKINAQDSTYDIIHIVYCCKINEQKYYTLNIIYILHLPLFCLGYCEESPQMISQGLFLQSPGTGCRREPPSSPQHL